ncbi:MAG: hypothetical protein IKQ18_02265 [Clostridia bacterium]|nr:hypothetical protein [Clostridia bacterium]
MRGWYYEAYTSSNTACSMDPNNAEYRELYDYLNENVNQSTGTYRNAQSSDYCDICTVCQVLSCLNCACRMCCR